MPDDFAPESLVITFRTLYRLQETEPTKARAAVIEDLKRRWKEWNGGDEHELIEVAIGGGDDVKPSSTPIDFSKLSTRAANILRSARISTVEQLSAITDADLLAVKQCGPKVVEEIREKLR